MSYNCRRTFSCFFSALAKSRAFARRRSSTARDSRRCLSARVISRKKEERKFIYTFNDFFTLSRFAYWEDYIKLRFSEAEVINDQIRKGSAHFKLNSGHVHVKSSAIRGCLSESVDVTCSLRYLWSFSFMDSLNVCSSMKQNWAWTITCHNYLIKYHKLAELKKIGNSKEPTIHQCDGEWT